MQPGSSLEAMVFANVPREYHSPAEDAENDQNDQDSDDQIPLLIPM